LCRLVVDGRPLATGGAARPDARGNHSFAGGVAAGCFPTRSRPVLLRQSARALLDSGARGDAGDLVPAAAPHSPPCGHRLHSEPSAGRRHAALRCRGQGRAAVDRPARDQYPALGIPQACLRHPHRLAVRESARRPEMPANTFALALLSVAVVGLVLQPDFGQTMLVALVWSALFFLAGMRLVWVVGLGGAAAIGLASAYMLIPHVARRIERFRDPSSGDTFNIDQALES